MGGQEIRRGSPTAKHSEILDDPPMEIQALSSLYSPPLMLFNRMVLISWMIAQLWD